MLAIETNDLTRTFKKKRGGEFVALDAASLSVEQGQIFGLLGPNGAGKTTLIKILATLLYPTSGTAKVGGVDVVAEPRRVRPLINMVSGGETSGYGILTVRENIWMFSQFYGIPGKVAHPRIDEYLERFGLAEDAGTRINKLSTGMRQKMNLIRGLVTDPKILFLDEPTLGLDAHIAREIRKFMAEWVEQSADRTILLTTHYMAEAEELCKRIAIIDRGRIVAENTPEGMRRELGSGGFYRMTVSNDAIDRDSLLAVNGLERADDVPAETLNGKREFTFRLADDERLGDVFDLVHARGAKVVHISKHQPGLEEVFLHVVGRRLGDAE